MRAIVLALALAGCASPKIEYRPVPAALIPSPPTLPTVRADELQCLSDDAYLRLAERERLRRQYSAELRALVEVGGDRRDEK